MKTHLSRRDLHRLFGAGLATAFLPTGVLHAQEKLPTRGGVLKVVTASEPGIIVDILQSTSSAGVANKVHEGLLAENLDGTFEGRLAERWQISEDGLSYTFHLRPGVKWHDGKPFTARDVAYSIKTLREVHPRRRATFANLIDIETPDPLTAVLRFSAPVPYLLPALIGTQSSIVAAHLYEGSDPRKNPYNVAPVGTGPYRFVEWERGSHYYLEANPDYWQKDLPLLEGILVRFIPDQQARLAAIEAGEVDIGFSNPASYEDLARLRDNPRFAVTSQGYRQTGPLQQMFLNLRTEPLKDVRVRQAIAHAIDIPDYIDRIWRGFAQPAPTAISPATPEFFDATLHHYSFDRARANQLLDEANFPRRADGTRFSLRLTYNPGIYSLVGAAQYMRSALAEIGIAVEINSYDFATYVKKLYTEGAYDIDLQTLVSGYDPTDGVQRAYYSANIQEGLAWSNHTHYRNARVDAIFEQATAENDPVKRRALYVELQQILYADLPAINLVAHALTTLSRREVHDHTTDQANAFPGFRRTWLADA
jgi:peptide/nickel transport system substrate-binding protein